MNVPNMLTILRMVLVPVFVSVLIYLEDYPVACGLITAAIFGITSLTDMLDGKIARKYNLVTTFGKVMDPLADKFMVFSAMITITIKFFILTKGDLSSAVGNGVNEKILANVLLWATLIVIFRELGVTSIRLVSSNAGGGVIPANFFGKAKTVTQIIAILVILIEYALNIGLGAKTLWIATYISVVLMVFMTVASGINYLKAYAKYFNPKE